MKNRINSSLNENNGSATPLVSIICFCRNAGDTIHRCIDSILAQDYPNIEIIVQDGASTDGTLEILKGYGDRIQLVSEPDSGSGDAMFRCLERVSGEIIGSCLADEELLPHAVSWGVQQMLQHPDAGAVYGDHYNIDIEGNITGVVRHQQWDFPKVLCSEYTPPFCASFFRRTAIEATGLRTYTNCGEFELWVLLGEKFPIVYASKLVAKYGVHEGALSYQVEQIEEQARGKTKALERFFAKSGIPDEIKILEKEALAAVSVWLVDAHCNMGAWHNNMAAWEKACDYFHAACDTIAYHSEFLQREGMRLLNHGLELVRDGNASDARRFLEIIYDHARMFDDVDLTPIHRLFNQNYPSTSELDQLIPPEIKDDPFYEDIKRLASRPDAVHILEIGSSAGEGSTSAFVEGIQAGGHGAGLYCMEISRTRYNRLREKYRNQANIRCYRASSVPLDAFPSDKEVSAFYHSTRTALNQYPIERVLGWLEQDKQYLKQSKVCDNGIDKIKNEHGIDHFDLVLIDGSEFTGRAELDKVFGAKVIMLDDINGYKNHHNYQRLKGDPSYRLEKENWQLRNGYAIFRRVPSEQRLPIHFFTIVLNGQPFLEYHLDIFKKLKVPWHWHIIEGVADLKHDTAWSAANGGRILDRYHIKGLSVDGTSEYLDRIAREYPDHITLYRKKDGIFWDGKLEMINAPLKNLPGDCLLWQVDADELWRADQMEAAHGLFVDEPTRTAAFFHCHFFVGPHMVTVSRNTYSHKTGYEWLRLWRYRRGMQWKSHEPPCLMENMDGNWTPVHEMAPFSHSETESAGLVFTHHAYSLESQVQFKEDYYGYTGAVKNWRRLQKVKEMPVRLSDYFDWVMDNTLVDGIDNRTIGKNVPPVSLDALNSPAETKEVGQKIRIVIDGVIFQLQADGANGISRVWSNLIPRLVRRMPQVEIILLQREGTEPRFDGVEICTIPGYRLGDADTLDRDDEMLRQACSALKADMFISTYYTRAAGVMNLLMLHDMIPEIMGYDLSQPEWLAKQRAVETADGYICVSETTRNDLLKHYPQVRRRAICVAPNGLAEGFGPPQQEEIERLKNKLNLHRPYLLMVGNRGGYKNGDGFLTALEKMPRASRPAVLCVGGEAQMSPTEQKLQSTMDIRFAGRLSDRELAAAYAGAEALCVPSSYEGFGLPFIEAMACGCPVVANASPAALEVGGDAIVTAELTSGQGVRQALESVREKARRTAMREKGFQRIQRFNWGATADAIDKFMLECLTQKSIILTAIVSTYNAEAFIRGCLEDLTSQTLAGKLEIIVVDSASEQDEAAVVRAFQQDHPHIKYILTPERESVYQAWNRGIKFATGIYVTNANTDDRHRQDAFERMVEVLEDNDNIALVYADVLVTTQANQTFRDSTPSRVLHWYDWDRRTLLDKGCFIGPQPVWRKQVHDEYGYFDEAYAVSSDFEFWLRISQTNDFYHISTPLGLYMDRPDSIEHANDQRKQKEDLEILQRYRKAEKENQMIGLNDQARNIVPFDSSQIKKAEALGGLYPDQQSMAGDDQQLPGGKVMNSPDQIIKAIEHLLENGHEKAANWAMGKLLTDFPDNARLLTASAVMAYEQKDMQTAMTHFERAVEKEPRNVLYLKNLGDFYHVVQKDAQAALALYEKVLQIEPDHVETLILAGHVSISMHRYNEAQQYYQRVKQLDPENAEVLPYLEKMNHAPDTAASPALSVDDLYAEAQSKAQAGDTAEAITLLEQLLHQDSAHAIAHNDLGVLKHDTGDMQAALTHYEKAVALMPENETFQKNLADFYLAEAGDHQAALNSYVQVLKLNPQDTDALLGCGQICIALGKGQDARDFLDTALQIEPWNQNAQELLRQLEQGNDPGETVTSTDDLYEQAQNKAASGDLQGAIEDLRKLLTQMPNNAKAHNDLGVLYFETGDKAQALASYEQALQLDPRDSTSRKNLADFYLIEQGRAEDAMKLYFQVLEDNARDIEALIGTAMVCTAVGKVEDAQHFYQRVLEIEPWNQAAQSALSELNADREIANGENNPAAAAG